MGSSGVLGGFAAFKGVSEGFRGFQRVPGNFRSVSRGFLGLQEVEDVLDRIPSGLRSIKLFRSVLMGFREFFKRSHRL